MARQFSGTGQYLNAGTGVYQPSAAGNVMSVHVTVKVDDVSTHRAVVGGATGSAGWYFYWNQGATALIFQGIGGAGVDFYGSNTFTPGTTNPETWGMEYDFDADSCTFYRNGVAIGTDTAGKAPAAGSIATYIGARNVNGTASLLHDGWLAELGIWDSKIGAAGFAGLDAGYAPPVISRGGLRHYWKLIGRTDPENDLVGGDNASLVGSVTTASHPRVIYPSAQILQFPPVAAPAGGIQVLRRRRMVA